MEDTTKSTSVLTEVIESGRDVWGMQSFNQHLIELYEAGHITKAVALRASDSPEKLRLYFGGLSHENREPSEVFALQKEATNPKWNTSMGTQELTLEQDSVISQKKKKTAQNGFCSFHSSAI